MNIDVMRDMPDEIKSARQAGLAALQPAPAALEHGLELHAAAAVCDVYGFAPRAIVDDADMAAAETPECTDAERQALWEEKALAGFVTDQTSRAWVAKAWRAAGVTSVALSAGEERPDVGVLLKRMALFTHAADNTPDLLTKVTRPEQIPALKSAGRHGLILGVNEVPVAGEWRTPEEELRYLPVFFQLGCRMMHLTYNRRNLLGDGCGEPANGGLSDFGRMAIREMNRVGIMVDVAHCGERTSLEAAQASEVPIVASHTVCRALSPTCRGKSDETMRAIVAKDGLIGIVAQGGFLGRSGDINALLDHIAYVIRVFGADYVGIGTDVVCEPESTRRVRKMLAAGARKQWQYLWPPDAVVGTYSAAATASLAWTNWPLFTVGLAQRGYKDDVIQKIIGGNFQRVMQAVTSQSRYLCPATRERAKRAGGENKQQQQKTGGVE